MRFQMCWLGSAIRPLFTELVTFSDLYIATDVALSAESVVPIVGAENITMLEYNNPTMYCSDNGGVKIASCNNIIIEGVVWENLGHSDIMISSVIAIYNSSNLTINNCIFKESQGQVLTIWNAIHHVNTSQCRFTDNNHYKGHGTAIHHTSMPHPTGDVLVRDNMAIKGGGILVLIPMLYLLQTLTYSPTTIQRLLLVEPYVLFITPISHLKV